MTNTVIRNNQGPVTLAAQPVAVPTNIARFLARQGVSNILSLPEISAAVSTFPFRTSQGKELIMRSYGLGHDVALQTPEEIATSLDMTQNAVTSRTKKALGELQMRLVSEPIDTAWKTISVLLSWKLETQERIYLSEIEQLLFELDLVAEPDREKAGVMIEFVCTVKSGFRIARNPASLFKVRPEKLKARLLQEPSIAFSRDHEGALFIKGFYIPPRTAPILPEREEPKEIRFTGYTEAELGLTAEVLAREGSLAFDPEAAATHHPLPQVIFEAIETALRVEKRPLSLREIQTECLQRGDDFGLSQLELALEEMVAQDQVEMAGDYYRWKH
ncbi:MAG: hypothetical protein ABH823_05445 [bacterium]